MKITRRIDAACSTFSALRALVVHFPGAACRSLTLSSIATNPNESIAQPLETRIERSQPAPDSLSFRIPASGNWGGLLWIAIGWNLFTWFCAVFTVAELMTGSQELERSEESNTPFKVIMSILLLLFIAVGWGMINMAVWHRFGTARLDLTPDSIRLSRTLFWRTKTYEASLSEVREVGLVEFYRRRGQPVDGIRIETDQASLCSALRSEKTRRIGYAVRSATFARAWVSSANQRRDNGIARYYQEMMSSEIVAPLR
jgi:hypothetical protein